MMFECALLFFLCGARIKSSGSRRWLPFFDRKILSDNSWFSSDAARTAFELFNHESQVRIFSLGCSSLLGVFARELTVLLLVIVGEFVNLRVVHYC